MKNINIMIVDDHPMMREALRTALAEEPGFHVTCEASEGSEAVALFKRCRPDVILMDLLMSGMDGLEAIRQIFESDPGAKILVVTSLEDENKILFAIQAGALGYFPKTAPRSFLIEAIHKVADGIPYLPGGIAQKLFHSLRAMNTHARDRSAVDEPLTGRQMEILALVGEGRSDLEIGKTFHLSEATVRSHIHNILQRLGLETRAQAVAYANRKNPLEE
jgi:NarL family two-component system response regulator LiaR